MAPKGSSLNTHMGSISIDNEVIAQYAGSAAASGEYNCIGFKLSGHDEQVRSDTAYLMPASNPDAAQAHLPLDSAHYLHGVLAAREHASVVLYYEFNSVILKPFTAVPLAEGAQCALHESGASGVHLLERFYAYALKVGGGVGA